MEHITRLKDGNYIGTAALEIEMIPAAANLDADVSKALKTNVSTFAEMVNVVSHGFQQQDTVLELLCITALVTGQTYAAQSKLFIVIRKYGRSTTVIQSRLDAFLDTCLAALQSASYVVKNADESWRDLTALLGSLKEQTVLSLEKQVRVGSIPGQMGYMCYTNPYKLEGTNNFSRLYEAMAQYPGLALSYQIIPTVFTQNESSFIQGVTYYIDVPARNARAPVQHNDAADYYRRTQQVLDKPQYLYNILLFGSSNATMVAGNRLRSILQHEDETVGLVLADRTGALSPYNGSFAMYPWNMVTYKTGHPLKPEATPPHFKRMIHMLSAAEVMTFFHAPIDDGMITGFPVNQVRASRETYGQGVIDEKSVQLGKLMGTGLQIVPFGAPLRNFTRHALVVGMPGTGKTTFSINLLLQFQRRGIPFLAIEPTKTEYRALIDAVPDLQVFTPGKNDVVPFVMNPFMPPEGITLEIFKPSLVSAFKAAFSMPSPLDILFSNAIDTCFVKHGWRGYSKKGDREVKPFGIHEFVQTFREVIRTSNYSAETKGNMESAGVFRLLNLVNQNANIYDTVNSVPLEDLLRKPTVIELNAIGNQEQKALVMALLLVDVILYTKQNQAGDGQLKNILLIDEAHVLLNGGASVVREGMADTSNSTVKALQDMIVEIRAYGTGIIIADQSPQKVTKEIVGNTDVKVMFQLVQAEDKRIIAASSNMSSEDEDQLSRLNTGEAFAYFRGLKEPARIMTEDIRDKEMIRLVVPDEELQRRMRYWDDKKALLKPYSQCANCEVCEECDFALRDDARYFVEKLFLKDKSQMSSKDALFARALNLNKRLRALATGYEGRRYEQLLYCACIRYIRKAALETPAILSGTETHRVLDRIIRDYRQEGLA